MQPSLSFFYQCYKQPRACRHAIENIRKIYKDETIYLFCDGGDPIHEEIAKSFDNVIFQYCDRISGLSCGNYPSNTKHTTEYLGRITNTINSTTSDFILLMEDDVHIKNKIDLSSLLYDLNGAHAMPYSKELNNYCKWWKHNTQQLHSGFGGTIMKRSFFNTVLTDPLLETHLNTFFDRLRPGPAGCDLLLTFITYVYEGTVGNYPGLCEKNWPDYNARLQSNSIDVLHQYKDYYS